jgi:hypothetical protein
MAFGNRLISTGSGGSAGVIGATLEALDFGFSGTYSFGMDAHDGIMFNVKRSDLLTAGSWTTPASAYTASYGFANFNGISRIEDGLFWVGNFDQYRVRKYSFTGQGQISLLNNFSVSGRVYDVAAVPNGFAYTDTDASIVRIYDNSGNFVRSWTPSQGASSMQSGLTWDGGGLWVSSGIDGISATTHKYDLNGNYLGFSFSNWAGRRFSSLGFDSVNNQFYGIQSSSLGYWEGTAARYNAILP